MQQHIGQMYQKYEAMNKPWDAAVRHQLADTCTKLNKPELARMWALAALACERR